MVDEERPLEPTMGYRQTDDGIEFCIFPDYTMIPDGESWVDSPAKLKGDTASMTEKRWLTYQVELAGRPAPDPEPDPADDSEPPAEPPRRRGRQRAG